MRKIIRLTERDLSWIVKRVINESQQKQYLSIPKIGCETFVKGKCDPYNYLKVVDGSTTKYYFKKRGTTKWVETKNQVGISAIEKDVEFNSTPETKLIFLPPPNQTNNDTLKPSNKINLKKEKLKRGEYTYEEIKAAVNAWTPKEDNSWGNQTLNSDKEYKRADWDLNVSEAMNKIHKWRNKIVNSLKSSGYSEEKKDDISNKLFFLTTLIEEKYETEHEKRWKSYFPKS